MNKIDDLVQYVKDDMVNKRSLISKNCNMTVKEIEDMTVSFKSKPSQIAASFSNILELEEHHLKHFKSAPYIFKSMNGTLWSGMLMDDKLNYAHLIMITEDVLNYILKL